MTLTVIALFIVAACLLAATTGFAKLIKVVNLQRKAITTEIEYDINKLLADQSKFVGISSIVDKDIAEENRPYLVVKQWYDNLHCTKEIQYTKTGFQALKAASDDNAGKTYDIINIIAL